MQIKSKEVTVNCSSQEAFEYLNDMQNFKNLLPEDKITNWEAKEDYCSFKVQNAATIDMKLVGGNEFDLVKIESGVRSPFPFTLDIYIKDNGNGTCSGFQDFNGKVNPFLKMMVQKPLETLFNHIADRLVEVKA